MNIQRRLHALTTTLALITIVGACGMSARVPADPRTLPPEVVIPAADTASEAVVVRTNIERKKLGLPELLRSNRLMHAAQIQADPKVIEAYLGEDHQKSLSHH